MNGNNKKWYERFLKAFFHDPIDKPFDIPKHESRAKDYAKIFEVSESELNEAKGSDIIASCMERSLVDQSIRQTFNEIRHPLSEGYIKLEDEAKNEWSEAVFKEIYEKINKEVDSDIEKKSFFLWRNLLEKLLEGLKEKEELRKYLPILPADTRVPDHSIWEHLKIATAVNASFIDNQLLQNNSLFLFTIGPVQSFIAQARKTQDAYMGSFILSYLTFIGIKEVVKSFGPTSIIYPDLFKQPLMDWYLEKGIGIVLQNSQKKFLDLPTIPNRFVAIIGTTEEEVIGKLVKNIKDAITKEVEQAISTVANKAGLNDELVQLFRQKLKDFPQMFWVALPWKSGNADISIRDLENFHEEETINNWQKLWDWVQQREQLPPNIGLLYPLLYTTLEKFMGARKNLREFEQLKDNEEIGRKCSVCGERAVLFYRKDKEPMFINNNLDFFYGKVSKDSFTLLSNERVPLRRLAVGEGLCALCFLKRNFDMYLSKEVDRLFEDYTFPSTAEVACADFKKKAYEKCSNKLEAYEEMFKKVFKQAQKVKPLPKIREEYKIDRVLEGYWFFEENLNEEILNEEGFVANKNEIDELKKKLQELYEAVEKKPCTYYALIQLDGDEIGKWLSGEKLPKIEKAYNSETWQNLQPDFKKELSEIKVSNGKKLLSPAIHASISTALRNYAIEFVRKIVEEEHLGKLIYAGGDDLLAFVNLEDLLDVMEKLRWAFSGQIIINNSNGEIEPKLNEKTGFVLKDGVYLLTMGSEATCSMGVVIAHYKEPLRYVFAKAKQMNKKAKSNGRDSFGIALIRRSGEEREGVAKWKEQSSEKSLISEMKFLKEKMDATKKPYISDSFIQKFKREFSKFIGHESDLSEEVFNSSLERLIRRSFNKAHNKAENQEQILDEFCQKAKSLFWNIGSSIAEFSAIMEILSFLNKRSSEVE